MLHNFVKLLDCRVLNRDKLLEEGLVSTSRYVAVYHEVLLGQLVQVGPGGQVLEASRKVGKELASSLGSTEEVLPAFLLRVHDGKFVLDKCYAAFGLPKDGNALFNKWIYLRLQRGAQDGPEVHLLVADREVTQPSRVPPGFQ